VTISDTINLNKEASAFV